MNIKMIGISESINLIFQSNLKDELVNNIIELKENENNLRLIFIEVWSMLDNYEYIDRTVEIIIYFLENLGLTYE